MDSRSEDTIASRPPISELMSRGARHGESPHTREFGGYVVRMYHLIRDGPCVVTSLSNMQMLLKMAGHTFVLIKVKVAMPQSFQRLHLLRLDFLVLLRKEFIECPLSIENRCCYLFILSIISAHLYGVEQGCLAQNELNLLDRPQNKTTYLSRKKESNYAEKGQKLSRKASVSSDVWFSPSTAIRFVLVIWP